MAPPEPQLVIAQILPGHAQLVNECSNLGGELHTYTMPNAEAHISYDGAISQQPGGEFFPGYQAPPALVPSYGPTSFFPDGTTNFENPSYENLAMMSTPIPQQSCNKEVDPQRLYHPQVPPQQFYDKQQVDLQQFYHQQIPPQQFYHQQIPPQQFYHQQVPPQQFYSQQVPPQQFYDKQQVDPQQFYHQQIPPQQFYHQQVPPQQFYNQKVPSQQFYDHQQVEPQQLYHRPVPLQQIQVEPQQGQAQPQQIQVEELHFNIRHIKRVDPTNREGMVHHLDGHMDHAANVMQRVKDRHDASLQFAERAGRIRAEINNLGDYTPPRAAQARKRRRPEQSTSPEGYIFGSSQGYEFGHGIQKATENITGQQGFASPGTHWGLYAGSMTPSQRTSSASSLSMSKGLPTPEEKTIFDVRTPENFNQPEHKRLSPVQASPSKRRKIEGVRKIMSKPLPNAAGSSTGVLCPAPAAWTDEKTDSNFLETTYFEDSIAGLERNSP